MTAARPVLALLALPLLALSLVFTLSTCRKDMSEGAGPPETTASPPVSDPASDPTTTDPSDIEAPTTTEPAADPRGSASVTETRPARGSTTPPVAATPKSGDPEPDRLAGITAAHNKIRADLKIAPLTWSPEIARYAQSWADKLQQKGCGLRHRPDSGPDAERYGENIFSMTGAAPTPAEVVDTWASEVAAFDAKTGRCRGVCGHYTQIVWRKSQRIGCGMAACGDTEVWVCNYDPPGNFVGERPY